MANTNETNEIVVSFDGVKMKELRAYWTALARSDWAGQDKFFARVVKSWSFELSTSDPDSYGELDINQYHLVQAEIRKKSRLLVTQMKKHHDQNDMKG